MKKQIGLLAILIIVGFIACSTAKTESDQYAGLGMEIEESYLSSDTTQLPLPSPTTSIKPRSSAENEIVLEKHARAWGEAYSTDHSISSAPEIVENSHPQVEPQQVLITPTGTKYHAYICGNGSYSPIDVDAAIIKGLSPCKKCYG